MGAHHAEDMCTGRRSDGVLTQHQHLTGRICSGGGPQVDDSSLGGPPYLRKSVELSGRPKNPFGKEPASGVLGEEAGVK